MPTIKGLEPVIVKNSKILILGSMPSVASLDKKEYYGFKSNRFWKIMGEFTNQVLDSYEAKLEALQTYSIILWDVIGECERTGSLDSAIKNAKVNDIEGLIQSNPSIKVVLCNGKKSYELYKKHFNHLKIEVISLPSTSNANQQMKEEELFKVWLNSLQRYYEVM